MGMCKTRARGLRHEGRLIFEERLTSRSSHFTLSYVLRPSVSELQVPPRVDPSLLRPALSDAMSTPQRPDSAIRDTVANLIVDAEIRGLMQRATQAEMLMERALQAGDPIQSARYHRLCEAACAACWDLLAS